MIFHLPEQSKENKNPGLIKKRAGLTVIEIGNALNIKNKQDLINVINSLKESDSIIFTYNLPLKIPTINLFSKEQIGDEKDPEKIKETMVKLIKERRIKEYEELKKQSKSRTLQQAAGYENPTLTAVVYLQVSSPDS